MSHQFSTVPRANIPRSKFDRSHGLKTTFDAGYLIPVFSDEVYPGDTFNLKMTAFTRLATPLKPIMDNIMLQSFFFFVPNRLIWENWTKFCGEQDNPGDNTDFLVPYMAPDPLTGYETGSLSDYLGIPVGVGNITHVSLYHRAYCKIWNDWFRDENLQDSIVFPIDDGPDTEDDFPLVPLKRNKRHDYFTSCLPWPQKGPAVDIPIGTQAPLVGQAAIRGFGAENQFKYENNQPVYETANGANPTVYQYSKIINATDLGADGAFFVKTTADGTPDVKAQLSNPSVYADLSDATTVTINQLRESFQIQKLFERDARGGTRYIEQILSHFGVVSPDFRLQRSEYLGGGRSYVNFSAIAQTSGTAQPDGYTPTPQGNLSAIATGSMSGHGFTKSFTEHGVVLGFVCAYADLTYQYGLERRFSRSTRFDYYYPALAHLGEQEVLNQEIFAQGTTDDLQVFGYQERWAELRYKPSLVTGLFRSITDSGLDIWHLSQDFGALPVLNSSFLEENPPIDRVIAVQNEPQFIMDAYFKFTAVRPLPTYSVPGLIDHF